MLNIYEKENTYAVSINGHIKNIDSFSVKKIESRWIPQVVEMNDEYINFEKEYSNLKNKVVDIKPEDVIYFFKESKYPRFKFASNCKNLKTIQIPKATYLVTPIIDYKYYSNDKLLAVECLLTNRLYYVDRYLKSHYISILQEHFKQGDVTKNIIELLKYKFLIQEEHYRVIEVIQLSNTFKNFKFLQDISENLDKCIPESVIDNYVNSLTNNELTKEVYDSLNTMLKSKDAGTIELGIKMLNNFDVNKYALKIASLIRLNNVNIERNKALQTVGFKNILSQLGTDLNAIKYGDTLQYYNNLYGASSNLEDKEEIKEYLIQEIKNRIINQYNSCTRIANNLSLNLNLNIT